MSTQGVFRTCLKNMDQGFRTRHATTKMRSIQVVFEHFNRFTTPPWELRLFLRCVLHIVFVKIIFRYANVFFYNHLYRPSVFRNLLLKSGIKLTFRPYVPIISNQRDEFPQPSGHSWHSPPQEAMGGDPSTNVGGGWKTCREKRHY